ncbi:unnamed protein product [Strongylus vulgaris]|uniref:Uncharacterized protein n=1 Tax=Strongylus vulgaris TaxID=40348 RepID=A0A3P7KK23_STRVU|nr:unnamed protein product [Strongylus vulgaris]
MTVPTSFNTNEKAQDSVESDAICVISGANARRVVYMLYVVVVFTAAALLYLFPSTAVICGFMVMMLLMLASLYPLVKFAIKTEDNDLIWDSEGLHWFRQNDVVEQYGNYANDLEQSFKVTPVSSNYYLSYAFI